MGLEHECPKVCRPSFFLDLIQPYPASLGFEWGPYSCSQQGHRLVTRMRRAHPNYSATEDLDNCRREHGLASHAEPVVIPFAARGDPTREPGRGSGSVRVSAQS